ncbi:MAG: nucleoside-diphosphate sugar epimerase/dehydratase [Verrucomicrobiota bacterium]
MSPQLRVVSLILLYGLIACLSYWGAWLLRFGFYPDLSGIPENFQTLWWQQGVYLLPLKLALLYASGQFSGFIRFFRFPDAVRLAGASGLFSFVCLVVWYFTSIRFVPPALVLAADFLLFTFFAMSARVGIRLIDEWRQSSSTAGKKADRVGIIGVGETGSSLAAELSAQPALGMRPVAFFDVNPDNQGRTLHGIPVLGVLEDIPSYYQSHDLDKIVLAMPNASPEEIRQITVLLKSAKIPLETIAPLGQRLSNPDLKQTREVKIEDLLYREPIALDEEKLSQFIKGHRVLVTGAGGSIGSELAFQIAGMEPAELIMLDRSEGALFEAEQRVLQSIENTSLQVEVADLRDDEVIDTLLGRCKPNVIFHAAAHKHVGMMERQPRESFANNTVVTMRFAEKALAHGVKAFCLISTDKAVEPTNAMGATKRLAEKAVQALVDSGQSGSTQFTVVRFGNVVGSSGSVIPIFEKQIEERRPVTVTDPAMTRYFMTIPEAVGLVLQATAFESAAALFTLEMGDPVRIDDMARDLIRLKGLEPDVDIPIVYTGIRPGEKLDESIHYPMEQLEATDHPKIVRVGLVSQDRDEADAFLSEISHLFENLCVMPDADFRDRLFRLANT